MKRATEAVVLALCLCACNEEKGPVSTPQVGIERPPHRDEPAHAEFPTQVRLSDEVLTAAGVRTQKVEREQLVSTIDLPGEISVDPDRSARVASPIAGRIEQVHFQEGQRVKQGDPLLVIRVPELGKVRSDSAATRAQAKAARVTADRLRELKDQQLASEQAYLAAEAEAQALELSAVAAHDRVQALGVVNQGNPSSLVLRAPLSGVVLARAAVVGQPVTSEQVVAEIADLSEVWFLGRVFEKDLGLLRVGAPSEVLLNAYPGTAFAGTVEYIGMQVDPIARTLTARIRLTNHDDLLRIGLFGSARVSTEPVLGKDASRPPVLVVPRGALMEVAGKQVVFVRQADRDFELHQVTTGRAAGGKVEILSGLRDGEQVVSEGAFTLKSSVLKASLSEGE
ncbi:MAG TPA: efflux RND transporter periplasmic adaptor subunit [Polyangiales bacterium]